MKKTGGYIGLIALLLSVAILTLMYVRVYTAPAQGTLDQTSTAPHLQPNNKDGTVPDTTLEQYRADIDAARAVQDMTNSRDVHIAPDPEE